ncbi:MAG: 4-alpha-glucanotransferase [Actinomycetota bacterium]|nr:4-alpha-glucanotransferase [Actinomycetota bacterium]
MLFLVTKRCAIETAIKDLAAATGVLTEWIDVWGTLRIVETDDLVAVLEALTSRPLDSVAQVRALIEETADDRRLVEPVLVAWDGKLPTITIRGVTRDPVIVTEDEIEIQLQQVGEELRCDRVLPLGYHQLHLAPDVPTSLVISAPVTAYPAPLNELGVLAPVYSMRSEHNDTGMGNLSHLNQLADVALVTGATVVGTLPLVATFPDQPSPYSPASRRAWNETLIDLTAVPGWRGTLPMATGDQLWVDYAKTGNAIRDQIATYAKQTREMPQIRSQIDQFAAGNPEIALYAEFRARCDEHGRNWRAWPESAGAAPDRVDYHITAQWLASDQLSILGDTLQSRGQYLYLDLPIGCHPDGFDIWAQPEIYARASVGAPPDPLFLGGQDWGLPAVVPHQSRLEGHASFVKAVRHQLSIAGLLRIDHVMGLHRMWWVPHGLAATQGTYVMQPTEEMFAIVCLESTRAEAAVVGENLGTVPPAVSDALRSHRLLGMKVAQDGLDEPEAADLIALSTHDTPPFAAWWKARDITDAADLGMYDDERGDAALASREETITYLEKLFSTTGLVETRDAITEWMATSEAAIALVNIDDLWEEERRQNIPGTDTERPNWRARHAHTMEELAANGNLRSRLENLHEIRQRRERE